MFYDTKMEILDSVHVATIQTIYADVQPHTKSISYEDGYTLEITHRAFCDQASGLRLNSYVRIADHIFIILDLKEWSDYLELYLYRCKPDFASGVN